MAEIESWGGDQANGLRRLFGSREPQVVAFGAGRDACGRTTLIVQSAVALAAAGHGVVIVDENQAPDNILTAFGLSSRHDLLQVVRGERSVGQISVSAAPLVQVIPAAKAARDLDHMGQAARQRLQGALRDMQDGASFVLVDCAASRRLGHLSPFAALAQHFVVVVAAQSAAITNAYALVKRVAQDYQRRQFQIAVSRARSPEEAQAIFNNMRRVAGEHLGVSLAYLGASAVPVTDHLAEALVHKLPGSTAGYASSEQTPFVNLPAGRPAARFDAIVS